MEMQKEFLGCVLCAEVIPITPANRAPEFSVDEETGQITETQKNDMAEFLFNHRDHPIEKFSAVSDYWSHKPFADPVREDFFEVTNQNNKKMVIKRWRKDINQPLQYQLFQGRITSRIEQICFSDELIKKQLLKENPQLPEWKVDDIVKGVNEILQQDIESIKEELRNNFFVLQKKGFLVLTPHPLHFLLTPDPELVDDIKDLVRRLSSNRQEKLALEEFIDCHSYPGGALALQVQLDFTVISTRKTDRSPLKKTLAENQKTQ